MNRREFASWLGLGLVAASLPAALAACTPEPEAVAPEEPDDLNDEASNGETGEGTGESGTAVGTVADLDASGQLMAQTPSGPVLVIRDPDNDSGLLAVDPTCPHAGCEVDWQDGDQTFVCPCHQSIFATDGSRTSGPANSGLTVYEATIEGDEVFVQA